MVQVVSSAGGGGSPLRGPQGVGLRGPASPPAPAPRRRRMRGARRSRSGAGRGRAGTGTAGQAGSGGTRRTSRRSRASGAAGRSPGAKSGATPGTMSSTAPSAVAAPPDRGEATTPHATSLVRLGTAAAGELPGATPAGPEGGNIVALHHLNFCVTDYYHGMVFYSEGLGATFSTAETAFERGGLPVRTCGRRAGRSGGLTKKKRWRGITSGTSSSTWSRPRRRSSAASSPSRFRPSTGWRRGCRASRPSSPGRASPSKPSRRTATALGASPSAARGATRSTSSRAPRAPGSGASTSTARRASPGSSRSSSSASSARPCGSRRTASPRSASGHPPFSPSKGPEPCRPGSPSRWTTSTYVGTPVRAEQEED